MDPTNAMPVELTHNMPGMSVLYYERFLCPTNRKADDRYVIWFDIDNTLYSKSSNVHKAMLRNIHGLLFSHLSCPMITRSVLPAYLLALGFSENEASTLRQQYYDRYGLTVRGLIYHHGVSESLSLYALISTYRFLSHSLSMYLDISTRCARFQ
jgi:hypothetical protein